MVSPLAKMHQYHNEKRAGQSGPSPYQRRRRTIRRTFSTLVVACTLCWGSFKLSDYNAIGVSHYGASTVDWDYRRDQVKEAFVTSWNAYKRHAWGKLDELFLEVSAY